MLKTHKISINQLHAVADHIVTRYEIFFAVECWTYLAK